ncbi:hypothetical protein ATZ36_10610 [Candidatus Endomicrobiellum trichonymphae]|uniref:Uncharacterized protein n=1 Tax=Endomicrobium trichonymphae TaxID=1408204 RepID=A0A1E5IFI8_ENDTX|nr:hypothetical protein ATZ36_10610 [Candidatus Endomicrobium trichonymphae]
MLNNQKKINAEMKKDLSIKEMTSLSYVAENVEIAHLPSLQATGSMWSLPTLQDMGVWFR